MAQLRWARIINTLLSVWSIQWARAQSEPDAFVPNAVPLAIRSPYLNAWVGSSNLTPPTWPGTWNGHVSITAHLPHHPPWLCVLIACIPCSKILGWAGFVRVDETAYQWQGMGGPGERTNFSGFSVTPTRTLFTAVAGPVQLNITFLSPIEVFRAPLDLLDNRPLLMCFIYRFRIPWRSHYHFLISRWTYSLLTGNPTLYSYIPISAEVRVLCSGPNPGSQLGTF